MPIIGIHGVLAVENQCLVLAPESIGGLNDLISRMQLDLDWNLDDIEKSGHYNTAFLENEVTKNLSRSFFDSGK